MERPYRKNRGMVYAFLIFIVVVVILMVFGNNGLLTLYRMQKGLDVIEKEKAELIKENKRLTKEIERLKTDRRYIGDIARKELGMIGKKEVIYRFEKK